MLVSEIKSRIQNKFEGGNSISADWYDVIKEAGEALLERINPPKLQRIIALYGGVSEGVVRYYCPSDVHVPSFIINLRDKTEMWSYVDPVTFNTKEDDGKFTIEYVNGLPFILARQSTVSESLEIDAFESVGGKTGVSLVSNDFNFLSGSGALQGTFSDTLTDVEETLASAIDISDFKRGIAVVPTNFEDVNKVESIELQLITDASNYYTMSSLGSVVGDNLVNGWNVIRFAIEDAVATGAPVDTNITAYKLSITMESGESQTVIIDNLTLYKTALYHFGYISNNIFIDRDTGVMKETAEYDDDIVNMERREAGILVYEGCRVVSFQATQARAKAKEDFVGVLAERYDSYWENKPSQETPLSYNQSADISKSFLD